MWLSIECSIANLHYDNDFAFDFAIYFVIEFAVDFTIEFAVDFVIEFAIGLDYQSILLTMFRLQCDYVPSA